MKDLSEKVSAAAHASIAIDHESSDNQKVLDHYYRDQARSWLQNFLVPTIRQAVKDEKRNDMISSPEGCFMLTAAHGAVLEDRAFKLLVN